MARDLDDVDRGILHMLQDDARNTTAQEIAESVGVSASTVRNRIERLETDGIIEGYYPKIDYEEANLPLQLLFVITAPATQRSEYVDDLLEIRGIVDVRETLTGRRNLQVTAVGKSKSDVARITEAIHAMGIEIESSDIVSQHRVQPFSHFYDAGTLGGSPE